MELQKETRRRFYVKVDNPVRVDIDGVHADGDVIEFCKEGAEHTFKTFEDCQKWIEQFQKNKNEFAPLSRVSKNFDNLKTKAVKVNDDLWSKMTPFMIAPDDFEQSDFVIFQNQLANTAPDRDGERFSLGFLKSLGKSIVGRSKISDHNRTGNSEGRFFDAQIEKLSADEFVQTLDFVPDRQFIKKLKAIEEQEGGIHWLITKYYMIIEGNEKMVNDIKAGIKGRFMSIGFAPPQGPIAVKDKNGESVLYYEWSNTKDYEVEAIEASDVFLGAQYGAGNRKSYKDSSDIPVIDSVEIEISAESEGLQNPQKTDDDEKSTNSANSEVKTMKFEVKALEFEADVDIQEEHQEAIEKAFADVESKVSEMVDSHEKAIQEKADEIKSVQKERDDLKAVIGDETKESIEKAKNEAKTLRDDLENWILKAQYALKQFNFDEKEAKQAVLAEKTLDELFELRKTVTAELSKKEGFNAAQLSSDFDFEQEKKDEPKKVINYSAYKLD